jgi:hypothetical protein
VRAATAIVDDAQSLGLDVRCGLHTGELERIDARLGGIAAHIGARVMALAGPAEVLVTGTVHDLVVGGGISFELAADAQLKGVPGRWTLYRVTKVDGSLMAMPLAAEEASGRLVDSHGLRPRISPRRPRLVVLGIAIIGALSMVALAAVVITLNREASSLAGLPSPSSDRPPSVMRIDPETHEVTIEVHDAYLSVFSDGRLFVVDGTLWHETPVHMVRRNLETGEALDAIDIPAETKGSYFGFGSLWFAVDDQTAGGHFALHRVDPFSGRTTAVIDIEEAVHDVTVGRNAIFVLTREEVIEIDPSSNQFADRDAHALRFPGPIGSLGEYLWICECEQGRITQWDIASESTVRTVELPQRGFILDDQRELSQGNVSIEQETVWLMDGGGGTITPVSLTSGAAGQPIGIPQAASWHVFGFESIWIAARDEVYRVPLDTLQGSSVSLPDGTFAGALAVDETTGAVWLANYVPIGEQIPRPPPSP